MHMDQSTAERIAAQVVADFERGIQFTGAFHGYPVWEVCGLMLRATDSDPVGGVPRLQLAIVGLYSVVRLLQSQADNLASHAFSEDTLPYYESQMRHEINAFAALLDHALHITTG